jgi:2-dehydropantoate 2-reductase
VLAEGDSPATRQVPIPVVEPPIGRYDLTAVFVRIHQVDDAVLGAIAGLDGDVLFLLNWAAGPAVPKLEFVSSEPQYQLLA